MVKTLLAEIDSFFSRDPAARSRLEVLICYPGLHAVLCYRATHYLWQRGWKLPARFLSQAARFFTGIEIHPGAVIGKRLFIDHGMGVVIGETATIGDNVTLYHGVTLGGTSWHKGVRHPQLGDHVTVGSGAQLLGPITIGDHVRIGSNAVVVRDVEPHATMVGVPARHVRDKDTPEAEHAFTAYGMPSDKAYDPTRRDIEHLLETVRTLTARIEELETRAPRNSGNGPASDHPKHTP